VGQFMRSGKADGGPGGGHRERGRARLPVGVTVRGSGPALTILACAMALGLVRLAYADVAPSNDEGCECGVVGSGQTRSSLTWFGLGAGVALLRRRRRKAPSSTP
jgi:hypothetical protein